MSTPETSVPSDTSPRQKTPARQRRYGVAVDPSTCDGCALCVHFCKPAVFAISRELNRRGVYPAQATQPECCNNCRLCEVACPQMSIAVWSLDEEARS